RILLQRLHAVRIIANLEALLIPGDSNRSALGWCAKRHQVHYSIRCAYDRMTNVLIALAKRRPTTAPSTPISFVPMARIANVAATLSAVAGTSNRLDDE